MRNRSNHHAASTRSPAAMLGWGLVLAIRSLGTDRALPPRTLPAGPPLRSPIPWVQTDLRIAHLPPADWRQIQEFARAGYQVIAVNTLEKWDHVGPRANDYPAEVVKQADNYLRRIVT